MKGLGKNKNRKLGTAAAAIGILIVLSLLTHGHPNRLKPLSYVRLSPTPAPTALPTTTPMPSPTPSPEPTVLPTVIPEATATPAPSSIPVQPETPYEEYFSRYSDQYKVNKDLLKQIANCESHFHPTSVNGDYAGMFQFATSTWQSTRASMGADTNPELRFDAQSAIETAAFKIGNGGAGAWAACL